MAYPPYISRSTFITCVRVIVKNNIFLDIFVYGIQKRKFDLVTLWTVNTVYHL